MYDPSIGRFLSEDLLGFEAGDENLYRYVNNQPTKFTDPSGFWRWPWQNGVNWSDVRIGEALSDIGTNFQITIGNALQAGHMGINEVHHFLGSPSGYGIGVSGGAGLTGPVGGFHAGGGGAEVIWFVDNNQIAGFCYIDPPQMSFGYTPRGPAGYGGYAGVGAGPVVVWGTSQPSDYSGYFIGGHATYAGSNGIGVFASGQVAPGSDVRAVSCGPYFGTPGVGVTAPYSSYYSNPLIIVDWNQQNYGFADWNRDNQRCEAPRW